MSIIDVFDVNNKLAFYISTQETLNIGANVDIIIKLAKQTGLFLRKKSFF